MPLQHGSGHKLINKDFDPQEETNPLSNRDIKVAHQSTLVPEASPPNANLEEHQSSIKRKNHE